MSRSARSVYVVREYIVGNVLIMSITARSDAHDVCALFVAVFTSELMHESRRWTPNPVPDEQCFEGIKVRQTWGRRNEGEWAAPRQGVAGETALGHRGPACEALRSGGIIGTGGALQLAGHARRASHAP